MNEGKLLHSYIPNLFIKRNNNDQRFVIYACTDSNDVISVEDSTQIVFNDEMNSKYLNYDISADNKKEYLTSRIDSDIDNPWILLRSNKNN